MKLFASLMAAMMVASSLMAYERPKKPAYDGAKSWTINIGVGVPQGDHKDAGVDTMFMVGADYMLGPMGEGTEGSTYVGVLGFFGSGDAGLKSRSYGIHYGATLNLGQPGSSSPIMFKLQGGYYNTDLSDGIDDNNWGFGGLVGVVWRPTSGGGQSFTVEGGYYFLPSVSGVDNNGWYVAVGIPFGGK